MFVYEVSHLIKQSVDLQRHSSEKKWSNNSQGGYLLIKFLERMIPFGAVQKYDIWV